MARKTQKVIGRHIKITAEGLNIPHAGFIPIMFQIGDLSLRHMNSGSKFRLIQLLFLPEQFDFFSQSQFHFHHRTKFIIDAYFLFTFRY